MSYSSEDFWQAYEQYANETYKCHIEIINLCVKIISDNRGYNFRYFKNLIDIGCGKTQMGKNLLSAKYDKYIGIDSMNFGQEIVKDYKEYDFKNHKSQYDDLAISLFSTECCLKEEEQNDLYSKLLSNGFVLIVAGFYYEGKENQEIIEENFELKSYQTHPLKKLFKNETRIIKKVPSNLFGTDVIEVWRVII